MFPYAGVRTIAFMLQHDAQHKCCAAVSTISSVKKEVHTWTRRGGEDSQDEEWSSRGPVKLQKMSIGVETAGDKAGLQCKGGMQKCWRNEIQL